MNYEGGGRGNGGGEGNFLWGRFCYHQKIIIFKVQVGGYKVESSQR